jgi:hypothetical protein
MGIVLALAMGAFGARAADMPAANPDAAGSGAEANRFERLDPADRPVATPSASGRESRQFETFEHQLTRDSAPVYTPSEHAYAQPRPRSRIITRSPFDDPANTASPG